MHAEWRRLDSYHIESAGVGKRAFGLVGHGLELAAWVLGVQSRVPNMGTAFDTHAFCTRVAPLGLRAAKG
ncbi:hypothetical protein O9K51_02904 [Purpureocillium lavendulum]|uniref:Uncharacterized protein n=1 Tax=Purpureocillium lavendulum TaxID=1247861 RepID=A0AB34G2L7_9HYPO|nr:hypothetical protein O9K51_02904 [Purpureocillium lavendulum]